jgi:hypothetical protein
MAAKGILTVKAVGDFKDLENKLGGLGGMAKKAAGAFLALSAVKEVTGFLISAG